MKTVLLVVLLAAALAMLGLALLQGRLLFDRRPISAERLARLRADRPRVEELFLTAPDGVRLHGWLVHGASRQGRAPLVTYFGGNGEEVSWMAGKAAAMEGWSLLLVNYRGYGLSEGRPGEKSLLRDAVFLYDTVTRRADIDAGRVVAMGRSIGSGLAIHLARERAVLGVILVSPYDSIAAVVRDALPFLPVALLLRHPFPATSWAAGVEVPLLALIGADDRVIRPERSHRLVAAWEGPREVRVIEGAGHNSIDRSPAYWRSIGGFLRRLEAGRH
jgi:hypothetical protein